MKVHKRQIKIMETNLTTTHPTLVVEWNFEKNGELKPTGVGDGSHKKVWWVCKNGHEWQAVIRDRVKGRGCPYCSRKLPIAGETDLMTTIPQLAKEWHNDRNGELRPTDVTDGSDKKVWWVCKEGHEWQATISNRKNGRNCPYCAGKIPIKGKTDLVSTYPQLQNEWDFKKNSLLEPIDVTIKSNKKVWWICKKGHGWQAQVSDRTRGYGCPYCSGRVPIIGMTDLRTTHPWLAEEWNYMKNGELKPTDVSAGSRKKVWWICKERHEWQVRIYNRTNGTNCPYCKGQLSIKGKTDLATMYPKLVKEWNIHKNKDLKPADLSAGSNKKVWWICKEGHEWQAQIKNRTNGNNCPYCAGKLPIEGKTDLMTTHPSLAKEWNTQMNGTLKPIDATAGSDKKVWWICKKGHEWQAIISSRVRGNGCPYCAGRLPIKGMTDLGTTHPSLVEEWNEIKNWDLKPIDVIANSNKKVWWICKEGHKWEARIADRVRGRGCPYCAGRYPIRGKTDLLTIYPWLAKEWNDKKNNELEPMDVSSWSSKKVWWECSEGHEWKASIRDRARGSGCPLCSSRR